MDVMALPTVYHESKGLSVFEALANGVPVVLPAHGTFPGIIEQTQGGVLYDPARPDGLARQLKQLALDPQRAAELGQRGRQAVHRDYHARGMAEKTLALYRGLRGRSNRAGGIRRSQSDGARPV